MEEKVCADIYMSVCYVYVQLCVPTYTCLVIPVKVKTSKHESVGEHSSPAQD